MQGVNNMTKNILTIAGSDTLAGGGLQADLKTFEDFDTFGLTVITCIAVLLKNEFNIYDVEPDLVAKQLNTIQNNVVLDTIKIGLIHNLETMTLIKKFLQESQVPIVLDPVLAFKETDEIHNNQYREKLINELFPLATIVTPNLKEAELLSQQSISNLAEMQQAAQKIYSFGPQSVIIKGGERLAGELACDLFFDGTQCQVLQKTKINKKTVNGAGCTFASAIAANLALDQSLLDAVLNSKDFVYQAIKRGVTLKNGAGNVWRGLSLEDI